MEESLIQFKTAKLAKEKGFNLYVSFSYWKGELTNVTPGYGLEDGRTSQENYNEFERYYAPTQSLLQKWLREVHKIDIEAPLVYKLNTREYLVRIYKNNTEIILPTFHYYKTYEEALEVGLQEALKLIKV